MNKRTLSLLTFMAAAAGMAAPAFAEECASDSDCPSNMYCGCTDTVMPDAPDSERPPEPTCELTCQEYHVPEDECATDADCPESGVGFRYACQEIGGGDTDCAEAPPCPEGESCPEPAPCVERDFPTWNACIAMPIPCETDADCGEGTECVRNEWESCSGGGGMEPLPTPDERPRDGGGSSGSDPGADGSGEAVPGLECETVVEQYCAPKWVNGCEVDADCGDGFTCREYEACACAGGRPTEPDGGAPDGAGSDAPDSGGDGFDDGECSCEGTGEFYCEPATIECEADADCPSAWTCVSSGVSTTPCEIDPDSGEETCDEGTETVGPSYCMPPGYEGWGGPALESGAGPRTSDDTAGEEGAPTVDSDNGAGGGDGIDSPTSPEEGRAKASGSGCTAAPTTAPGGLALFGLAGLLLGLRRRK
jgi:MYXO-CTERM domain-containing protein